MAKPRQQLVEQVFTFANEAELDARIQTFKKEYEAAHGDFLALDQKRPLGPGKTKLSFRVVEKPDRRR